MAFENFSKLKPTKPFIANMQRKLSDAELKQMLTQFGQVHNVILKTDEYWERKGWGFVEMR